MITILQNAITDFEIKELLNYWNNNLDNISRPTNEYKNYTAQYFGLSLIDNLNDFSFLRKIRYTNYDKIRIQKVDNTIEELINHTHPNPYTFVVFLNDSDEFEGGDIVFDNIRIRPKKGQMIYFDNTELHLVESVKKGERFTLVGFTKDAEINPYKINLI